MAKEHMWLAAWADVESDVESHELRRREENAERRGSGHGAVQKFTKSKRFTKPFY